MGKYRSRRHCLLLYPDDLTHVQALDYIEKYYKYAYILHDKDVIEETGELKKAHWHVVVETNNATWNTALSKEFGISENYIQECRNIENSLEYLIHYNEEKKYQYTFEDVKGSLKKKLKKYLDDDTKDENIKAMEILNLISSKGYIDYIHISSEIADMGLWPEFRRATYLYVKIIDEHNLKYKESYNESKIDRL